jgi:hypothetical protein
MIAAINRFSVKADDRELFDLLKKYEFVLVSNILMR